MNVYTMIIEMCAWVRANPTSPIKTEMLTCKSYVEMFEVYKKLVLDIQKMEI